MEGERVRSAIAVVVAADLSFSCVKQCWAWGATGHEWISGIAIEKLSNNVPALFVRGKR